MDSEHQVPPVGSTFDLGFGELSVFVDAEGTVIASGFDSLNEIAAGRPYTRGELPDSVRNALVAWQAGDFAPLMAVPVRLTGTEKLKQLRRALRQVDAGRVVTYSELAEQAGLPGLPRLAGRACSENACLLFVPCHRVVAATNIGPPVIPGAYAGSGDIKARLLAHEGVPVRSAPAREDASGF